MDKTCTQCQIGKELSEFGIDKRANDGRKSECKSCRNSIEAERRKNWTPEQHARHNKRTKQYLVDNLIVGKSIHLVNAAKIRAREKGWLFTINRALIHLYLEIGVCQKSGLPFRYGVEDGKWKNPFAPSLDRHDNSHGYTIENVKVVCNLYNQGKGEFDDVTFIAFCMAVADKNKNNKAAIDRLNELRSL